MTDSVINPPELPVVQQEVPSQPQQDEFISTFRSMVDGLPEDITRETLVPELMSWQQKAAKADELQAELDQFRANQAAAAAEFASKQQSAPVIAPTEDDFKLPWNLSKVDPSLESLCKVDPETGMYVPKNEFSPTHMKAAEEMNQHSMEARTFIHALTTDPEGTAAILTKRQLAAMKKEFADELKAFKEQFAPIQERAEEDRRAQEINDFAEKKKSELFLENNEFTPVGALMDEFLRDGLKPDVAFEKASKLAKTLNLGLAAPAPTPAPALQKPKERFIDKLSSRSRLPVDRPEFEEGPKKHMTNAEMRKKYNINGSN